MAREHILVVEDEEDIQELIRYNLSKEGFRVTAVSNGEAAFDEIKRRRPDLVLLDLMLPGVDGLEVCRRLKGEPRTASIPLVMVTAKGEEADVVAGLELGAHDYITKPFSPKVLVARVRALLRRAGEGPPSEEAVIETGDLTLHPGRREVTVQGKPVELTFSEFSVLRLLAARPGWVFTRYQIIEAIRGDDYPAVTDRSVDVLIVGLRRKLGPCGDYIQTVRGVGYRFKSPPAGPARAGTAERS